MVSVISTATRTRIMTACAIIMWMRMRTVSAITAMTMESRYSLHITEEAATVQVHTMADIMEAATAEEADITGDTARIYP